MQYPFTPEQIESVNNLVELLSEKESEDSYFTHYWGDYTDSGYATDLLIELFDLDPENEDMDWGGAFLDILSDHDYPEIDVTLLQYYDYDLQAQWLVKIWINDNFDSLKESIEEYLAESEI